MSVQIIQKEGQPEWAIIPYEEYIQLLEQAEMLEDIRDYDRIKEAIKSGEEEILPADLVYALVDGENPVRVWREYRGYTQQQLAEKAGISIPFLSQIESGSRNPSSGTLVSLAKVLGVTVDDLLISS